jgi:hypothetical protein
VVLAAAVAALGSKKLFFSFFWNIKELEIRWCLSVENKTHRA